mmetsp:Transcript_6778/g.7854  ORF Transcript_6778/g.7854 Transcript_6778/m.7854 type:complete len:522 (+) Transcript_6778:155-1720(+)
MIESNTHQKLLQNLLQQHQLTNDNNPSTSSTKNATRISSILGTWTGQTHLKTSVGAYELEAYFVLHIVPDPMRGYGCSLEDCSEMENKVCAHGTEDDGTGDDDHMDGRGGVYDKVCKDMVGQVSDWSDVVAFMAFGAKIDVGFPFNKHHSEDMGGWVGPISIIMAQNQTLANTNHTTNSNNNDGTTNNILVDQYASRYIETPTTPYLKMPESCTLLEYDDFEKGFGPTAVRNTVQAQYDPNTNASTDSTTDPYQKYLQTCDNGDVKPLLPRLQFDFVQDGVTGEERVEVEIKYKLLTIPHKKDYVYSLYPMVQRRFNNADLGFHISGPYCYGDDPKRGYTFDMDFDTKDPKSMIQLDHGCIDGLPCVPPVSELQSCDSKIDVQPSIPGATIDIGHTLYFTLALGLLFFVLLLSMVGNCRLRRKLALVQQQRQEQNRVDVSSSRVMDRMITDPSDPSNVIVNDGGMVEEEEEEERGEEEREIPFTEFNGQADDDGGKVDDSTNTYDLSAPLLRNRDDEDEVV